MGKVRVDLAKGSGSRTVIEDESISLRFTDYGVVYFPQGIGGGGEIYPWHTVAHVTMDREATELLSRGE